MSYGVTTLSKDRLGVLFEEVVCHVGADDFSVRFQGVCVADAKFGGDFESEVDQLAEMWIVVCAMLVVPECCDIMLRGP